MINKKSLAACLKWITAVSERFSRVDRNGRSAVTSLLASLSICFGVMTLVVVMCVMNGFQMGFKDAILQISSYHVRVSCPPQNEADGAKFEAWARSSNDIVSVTPFYEAESFMVSKGRYQSASVIRAVPADVMKTDPGFAKEMNVTFGSFDLADDDAIVLGSGLAYSLNVRVGSEVTLLAMSGGNDVALLSSSRKFRVTGIFHSGYSDINSSYSFININAGKNNFGKDAVKIYGVKLRRQSSDESVILKIRKNFPLLSTESWRSYNKSFFGVLRVEKNILLMLVLLIFVVVGINIYNGMRRLVYERRGEISVLSALGGHGSDIQLIFIMRGFITGVTGAFAGVLLGLLLSVNMGSVFRFASSLMYYVQYFSVLLFNPSNAMYVQENPMYLLYAAIPARIVPAEIVLIALFGILAPLTASYAASKNVLGMNVAEVLHDE